MPDSNTTAAEDRILTQNDLETTAIQVAKVILGGTAQEVIIAPAEIGVVKAVEAASRDGYEIIYHSLDIGSGGKDS